MLKHHHSYFIYISFIVTFFYDIVSANGILVIKSNPINMNVWIDDIFIGQTPEITNHLKPGHHSLKLIDPVRHYSYTEDIFIKPDDTTFFEKTIEPRYGVLAVSSKPENASVLISSELGKTPLHNEFINPGKYRIEIRPANTKYIPAIQYVNITQGNTASITKTLEKKNILNRKAKLRLILGAGCVTGFVFAIIENGNYKKYQERVTTSFNTNSDMIKKRDTSNFMRIMGIVSGSLCITGLEIISFF